MTLSQAKWRYITLKAEQGIRQADYEQALDRSSEADQKLRDFISKCQRELGVTPEVFWPEHKMEPVTA